MGTGTMKKPNDTVEDIIEKNRKTRQDNSVLQSGANQTAEFLDQVNKHPGMDKDELMHKILDTNRQG
jgi:hypothetical protein